MLETCSKQLAKMAYAMLTQMEPAAKVAGKRFGNTIEKVLDMVESIGRAGCQNVFAEDIHCPETSQGRRYPTLCFHVPG